MTVKKLILLLALMVLLVGVASAGEVSNDTTTTSADMTLQETHATIDSVDEFINEEKIDSINKLGNKNIKKMDVDENSPEYKEYERYYETITESTNDEVTFNFNSDITLYDTAYLNTNIKKLNINGNNKTINGNSYNQFLVIEHNCTVTINNIKIINCYCEQDGSCISNEGNLTITNSILNNNKADRFGGAINNHGTLTLTNVTLNNNKAAEDGGAINNEGKAIIKNCNLNNNTASGWGGAIFNEDLQLTLTNTTLNKNTAKYGGAIHSYEGNIILTGCTLNNNNASNNGGAIHAETSKTNLTITTSTLNNNNAIYGAAVFNSGNMTVKNSKLNNNKAEYGAAVFNSGIMTVKNSKLNNNKAEYGGAIFLNGTKNNINNNTFSNNNALIGGAIFNANNNTTIKNNTFSKNTVSGKKLDDDFWSPYVTGTGGAIANGAVTYEKKYSSYGNYYIPTYLLTSDINITENQFINNTGESGGAISILGGTNININKNKFQNNIAQEEGSAIYDKKHEYEEYRYSANGSPIGSVTISIGTNINIINNTFTTNKANTTGKTIKSNASIITNNNIKTDNTDYPSTIYTQTEESKITNNIFNKEIKNTKTVVQTTSGTIGEKLTLKATVKDTNNNKVNEGNLIFKLNGITIKDNGKLTGSSNPLKVKVTNGVATATVIPDLDMRNANKLTAKYVGTDNYNASESSQVKIQVSQRNASIVVSSNVKTIKQGQVLTITAKVYDTTNGKRSTNLTKFNDEFVYFKVNGITLKDSKGAMQKVKVVNGTATIKYAIPLGLSGVTDGKTFTVKNHTILAGFYNKNYLENIRNTSTFQVERSNITITISNATVNNRTHKLSLTATIKDYLGNKVVGPNKCIIKVNGVTLKNGTKPTYYFASYGVLNIKNITIPAYNKYTIIEIVTQDRLAYKNQRNTTNVIKVVK